MRKTEQSGPASFTHNKHSRRQHPEKNPANVGKNRRNEIFDETDRQAELTMSEFACSVRESLSWLTHNVERLAHDAEKLREYNIEIQPLGSDGTYRAWITEDSKVAFTVEDGEVHVSGCQAAACGQVTDEQHAKRTLVKTILEDPHNASAVIAATEICGYGQMRSAWRVCQAAAKVARNAGFASDGDNTFSAARKLIERTWIEPVTA